MRKQAGSPSASGVRKLFLAQYHLEGSGLASHGAWLEEWRKARSKGFFLLGSGDETNGNQTATLLEERDGTLTLRLRLPDALAQGLGEKYLWLFPYGGERVREALRVHGSKGKGDKGPALSYRFVRKPKGWYRNPGPT